jgi:tripartite-type tricarboxylate transporter receptor subunit TctC
MRTLKNSRVLLACLLSIMAVTVTVGAGYAADAGEKKYPTKAITMIVPFAPGGGVDLRARVVAHFLSKEWGVPVNIVCKEGGNTVTGTLEMMKSKPDGYTVMADNFASASFQVVLPDLPYKIEDRTNLGVASVDTLVFEVNSKSPWKDLKDVAAAAKKNPENFKWGSLGGVSGADLCLQQFFADAGIDLPKTKTVRFKGAGDAVVALAGGHIDFTASGLPAAVSYLQSGMLRLVGVTFPAREYPEVKTAIDQGFQKVTSVSWMGYSGPPGVPKSVVTIWEQTLEKITNLPEFKEQIAKIGSLTMFAKSDDMRRMILRDADEARKWLGVKGK